MHARKMQVSGKKTGDGYREKGISLLTERMREYGSGKIISGIRIGAFRIGIPASDILMQQEKNWAKMQHQCT